MKVQSMVSLHENSGFTKNSSNFVPRGEISQPVDEVRLSYRDVESDFTKNRMLFNATQSILPASPSSTTIIRGDTRFRGDRAVVYMPEAPEYLRNIKKFPVSDARIILRTEDARGMSHFIYTSGKDRFLKRINERGEQELSLSMPDERPIEQILHDEKNGSLFVRTDKTLYKLDWNTGNKLAALSIGDQMRQGVDSSKNSIFLNDQNELIFASGGKLKALDRSLRETGSESIGFEPDVIKTLPGGLLLFASSSSVLLRGPDGKKLFESNCAIDHSTVTGSDGKLYLLEASKESGHSVVIYNPADNSQLRYKVADDAASIVPLPDGMTIIAVNRWKKAGLFLYSKTGKLIKSFRIPLGVEIKEALLTEDGKKAYLVVNHYSGAQPTAWSLYCLDIAALADSEEGIQEKISSFLRGSKELQPLYRNNGWSLRMKPAVLSDGRIILEEDNHNSHAVKILSPNGSLEKNLGRIEEVPGVAGAGVKVITHSIPIAISKSSQVPTWFEANLPGRELSSRGNPSSPKGGNVASYSNIDSSLGLSSVIEAQDGVKEMGFADGNDYRLFRQDLIMDRLFSKTSGDLDPHEELEIPYQDSEGWSIKVKRYEIKICAPDTKGNSKPFHGILSGNSGEYTAALPISAGKRHFIASATSDGHFSWWEMKKGNANLNSFFDVGSPVRNIAVSGGNRIIAAAENGSFIVFRPDLEEGETLSAPDSLKDGEGLSMEKSHGEIAFEDGMVNINGIKIPVKRRDVLP